MRDDLDDVDARRQFERPLLEPEEHIVDRGDLRLGLFSGDLASGEPTPLAGPSVDGVAGRVAKPEGCQAARSNFHHLLDPAGRLAEMVRTAKTG